MMLLPRRAALGLAALSLLAPCRAESLASSASSAGSASVGSVSDSLSASSNSSRRDDVAEGEYRILEVAQRPERPGKVSLRLQALDPAHADAELWLDMPPQALARRALAAGDVVRARKRAYGFEFAHADTREAFFLVLADAWHRELDARPVRF